MAMKNATKEDPVVLEVRAARARLWEEGGGTMKGLARLVESLGATIYEHTAAIGELVVEGRDRDVRPVGQLAHGQPVDAIHGNDVAHGRQDPRARPPLSCLPAVAHGARAYEMAGDPHGIRRVN